MTHEWGRHGIRVNAVAPDMIATPRLIEQMDPTGHDFEAAAQASAMPLGRAGRPEDIAGPLVFLCSDLGSFVAGQTIIADGGTHAAFPHVGATELM